MNKNTTILLGIIAVVAMGAGAYISMSTPSSSNETFTTQSVRGGATNISTKEELLPNQCEFIACPGSELFFQGKLELAYTQMNLGIKGVYEAYFSTSPFEYRKQNDELVTNLEALLVNGDTLTCAYNSQSSCGAAFNDPKKRNDCKVINESGRIGFECCLEERSTQGPVGLSE